MLNKKCEGYPKGTNCDNDTDNDEELCDLCYDEKAEEEGTMSSRLNSIFEDF